MRILLIEDEETIRVGLRDKLCREGHEVLEAADGRTGLEAARNGRPDLVLLDLMLPGMPGLEVLRALREGGGGVPVIILTARDREADRVAGLELGADDYVTKPFSVRELLARVRAILRRTGPGASAVVRLGAAEVDFGAWRVRRDDGRVVDLKPLEAKMLRYLLARRGRVVPRNEFLNAVWGYDAFPTTRTIDFHIKNLRRKLEPNPARPRHILTVHGVGYRLE